MPRRGGHFETPTGDVGRNGLAQCANKGDGQHHPNDALPLKQQAKIDEHAHTDEEIGNEDGVADELDAVHQRRKSRNIAVKNKAGKERTEYSFEPNGRRNGRTKEENGHHKDELHHGIAVSAQEPTR